MAEDDEKGYRWETEYEKSWEELTEDAAGLLQASVDEIALKAKRRKLLDKLGNIRLGMMRHLYIIIDMSVAMEDQDLKPTRLHSTLKLLEHFIEEYFDQNPISQLGIITTRNKRAEKVTELGALDMLYMAASICDRRTADPLTLSHMPMTADPKLKLIWTEVMCRCSVKHTDKKVEFVKKGNPRRHISAVKALVTRSCQGEPSLQNSLELALQTLRHMPSHASREILILFASLTTCDPGNIKETVQLLKENNISCSIIGLAAEVRICKKLCHDTNGRYGVILDEPHYKDLLTQHITPPPATVSTESSLIRMGFPHHQLGSDKNGHEKPSMCMCHLDSKSTQGFSSTGYFCPQCKSKYCELPIECKACGLTLVSAPHLARSYHHLFPLEAFHEMPVAELDPSVSRVCHSCQAQLPESNVYVCGKCQHIFCIDCDLFVHETLHTCPGCASSRATQMSHMSL